MSVDVPVIFCQACITTNINHMDAGHLVVNLTSWIQHIGPGQSFCTDLHMCPKSHLKTVRTDREFDAGSVRCRLTVLVVAMRFGRSCNKYTRLSSGVPCT